MVKSTLLYDRLEVSPSATTEEIIQAGRRLSKKWHPDKNHENREMAEERFKEIRQAVEILSDSEKRNVYDQFGLEEAKHPSHDPFMSGFPFPFPHQAPQNAPQPVIQQIYVSLEELAQEANAHFSYERNETCEECNGEGSKDSRPLPTCQKCRGTGSVMKMTPIGPMMMQQTVVPCTECKSTGKHITSENMCTECHGVAFKKQNASGEIRLKSTLQEGNKLKLDGHGHQLKSGKTDLILVIHVDPHPIFNRKGNDLCMEIELTLSEALFGFSRLIDHVSGRLLRIHFTGKTDYGTSRRVKGQGMTRVSDLLIKFTFRLPTVHHLSELKMETRETEEIEDSTLDIEDIELEDVVVDDDETSGGASPDERDFQNMENMQTNCRPM